MPESKYKGRYSIGWRFVDEHGNCIKSLPADILDDIIRRVDQPSITHHFPSLCADLCQIVEARFKEFKDE